jgi:hypothetical protein
LNAISSNRSIYFLLRCGPSTRRDKIDSCLCHKVPISLTTRTLTANRTFSYKAPAFASNTHIPCTSNRAGPHRRRDCLAPPSKEASS